MICDLSADEIVEGNKDIIEYLKENCLNALDNCSTKREMDKIEKDFKDRIKYIKSTINKAKKETTNEIEEQRGKHENDINDIACKL